MKTRFILTLITLLAFIPGKDASCQEQFSLKRCLDYALDNNQSLQKDRLGLQTSALSKKELIGSLLPQINASSGITRNIQKTTFAMPNFVNSMMPEPMRDPNAAKYMVVTMGMDLSANWGASLTQQIINFSLFNALSITEATAEMAGLGVEMSEDDVIAQTATFFYNAQVLEYALSQFDESISLMDKTLSILKVNEENGIVRKVDLDRVTVAKTNLETQRSSMVQALEVQKKLLKLQMGFPMEDEIEITTIDIDLMERQLRNSACPPFDIERLLPFKLMQQQKKMADLQYKSAVYETLPAVALTANYSMNYMGDQFKGETFYHFPVSMVALNLRMPIFTGMSKTAKVKKAKVEMLKAEKDEQMLRQSLAMNHSNSQMQLEQQLRTIESQHKNKDLAEEVYGVTELNFGEGISSLSDVLNASSSLIEAQMNYVNALSNGMKAYIDLKKADGSIKEIKQ